MIKVTVTHRSSSIDSITIKGHAGFAEEGRDLICAAISAIGYGLMNAIDEMEPESCDIIDEENKIIINVNHDSVKLQNILSTALIMIKTVEEGYPRFVSIKNMEVKQ